MFNEFNARSIGADPNVMRGLLSNAIFVGIIAFTVVMQWGIVEFGGEFVRTVPLTGEEWYQSVLLAALTLPVGGLMRLLPVWESADEFAPRSALIAHKQASATHSSQGGTSLLSFSGLIWAMLVALVCKLNHDEFHALWGPQLSSFLQQ